MLDARLSKIRQKTAIRFIENENESKVGEDHIHIRTDYSDSHNCQNCQKQQLIINELKAQILENQKQIGILQIEKDIIQKKEEQTIKLLIQEIEKTKLDQKKYSFELQQSLIQFVNDNVLKQSQTPSSQDKSDQQCVLNSQLKQIKEENANYAKLLHQQYDFSININIKFVQLSNSLNTLINLIQKYTKIITHIQMQSSPQLDLLLPGPLEDHVKQDHQQQLLFIDLHDMTSKIQQIQIGSLTDVQQKIETLIQLVADYFTQAQRIAINDMSRTMI
ncbi:unnamed protein product (macronuclear) [Paramecium tetraurelia]|uniref:Uncharacterized protein n=1 Tax=Paramecium tetraurelia TaxID=5888 RepID=A0E4L1_PARTE|nr:uncharacterized protein GSPATT00023403001 [Paramecium tetraurelia]CAK90228.1 unnamed protein product [Paramecium tetraurelia]|eukprot:XP_001457625.1 hypothetical protein (macronuclear) [Paramecium tetraurelia strain d4-2]